MSHMEICTCTLKQYNREKMLQAIELARRQLGGQGLLNVHEVRGYGHQKVPADLVFRFQGMNYPMGIRMRDGQVEFVGDRWGSQNWEQVKREIVAAYKQICVAIYFQQNSLSTQETRNDEQGILMEGYR